jgi:hypothetical protein
MSKSTIAIAGATLGVIVLTVAYVGTPENDPLVRTNSTTATVDTSSDPNLVELASLQEDLDQRDAERIQLKQELALARSRLQELEETPEVTPVESEDPPAEKESKPEWSLENIRDLVAENANALEKSESVTEMVYADFLYDLELDSEILDGIRGLLQESYLEGLVLETYAKNHDEATFNDLSEWQSEEQAFLDNQMRSLLPDEHYAKWTAHMEDIDARKMDANFRPQIQSFANRLSSEDLDAVTEATVEEFRAVRDSAAESNALYNRTELAKRSLDFVYALRERLQGFLPDDQLAQIETWLKYNEDAQRQRLKELGAQ